jgi:hypothetical protein
VVEVTAVDSVTTELAQAALLLLAEIKHGIAVERQWDGFVVQGIDESEAAARLRRALERWEAVR